MIKLIILYYYFSYFIIYSKIINFLYINYIFMIGLSDKNATSIKPLKKTYKVSNKEITFEVGKMGLMAQGTVTMSDNNDNVLFVTAGCKEKWVNEEAGFFPLVVDFVEKFYATWKIGGNRFMKREGRPSETATLTSRMIDRPIRPMFPKGIVNDTQIIATVLSANNDSADLGYWGITWASLALMQTGMPFDGPVSGAKVSMMNDWSFVYDPTFVEQEESKLNIIVAGTMDALTMVEADWKEVSNEEMLKTLAFGHDVIKEICAAQTDFIADFEKQFGIPEFTPTFNNPDVSLYEKVKEFLTIEKLDAIYNKWKKWFQDELDKLDEEVKEFLVAEKLVEEDADLSFAWDIVYKRVKEVTRYNVLENEKRLDGRGLTEVRDIIWETSVLPRTHGSAIFQRGMTQVLNICTLGWPEDILLIDDMYEERTKRYIHHYNFPPYSVWEVRMMRGVGRREVGHGKLAEKALEPVLPSLEDFPYMIRTVSEVTSCNGSSSMASVCGSTMSLMNAWVPITSPVSAVAMGMIYDEESGNYKILSDIQAQEDFLWDMDFKVARSAKWITAMQLDVKIKWLKMEVFEKAFAQWSEASEFVLGKMLEVQAKVSPELSKYAPLIMTIKVPEDKIRVIIGKWGENVQRMEKEYGVKVSIDDDGTTTLTAPTQEWWEKAINDIKEILWEPNVGYKSKWKVVKILEWMWAIVEFRGKSGMIHISKLSYKRVENVEDYLRMWDEVDFEIIQVDLAKGRIGLKRELSEKEQKEVDEIRAKKDAEIKARAEKKTEEK